MAAWIGIGLLAMAAWMRSQGRHAMARLAEDDPDPDRREEWRTRARERDRHNADVARVVVPLLVAAAAVFLVLALLGGPPTWWPGDGWEGQGA